jgi:hypothetical protein
MKLASESAQIYKFHRKNTFDAAETMFFSLFRIKTLRFGIKKAECHFQNIRSGSISLPKRQTYGVSYTIKKQPPEGGWQGEGGTLQAKV